MIKPSPAATTAPGPGEWAGGKGFRVFTRRRRGEQRLRRSWTGEHDDQANYGVEGNGGRPLSAAAARAKLPVASRATYTPSLQSKR